MCYKDTRIKSLSLENIDKSLKDLENEMNKNYDKNRETDYKNIKIGRYNQLFIELSIKEMKDNEGSHMIMDIPGAFLEVMKLAGNENEYIVPFFKHITNTFSLCNSYLYVYNHNNISGDFTSLTLQDNNIQLLVTLSRLKRTVIMEANICIY